MHCRKLTHGVISFEYTRMGTRHESLLKKKKVNGPSSELATHNHLSGTSERHSYESRLLAFIKLLLSFTNY